MPREVGRKGFTIQTPQERTRGKIALVFSVLVWAVIILSLVGLLYGAAIAFFVFVAHALAVAWIRMNGVHVSEEQLPELHERVERISERLGMVNTPEVYVMHSGGALNAFATKLFSRGIVVIYSELLEACDADPEHIDFIVGHELGHLALGHLQRRALLAPARIVPWLGPALSRAYEYSCDRCGLVASGSLEAAQRALSIVAAGGVIGRRVSLDTFAAQRHESGGFWPTVLEISSSHPFLPKRLAALEELMNPATRERVRRSRFGVLLAPIVGAPAGGASAASPIIAIAVIGVLAAIAIPNFLKFQARSRQAEATSLLERVKIAQLQHKEVAGRFGAFDEIGPLEKPTHYTLYMGSTQRWGADLPIDAATLGGLTDDDFVAVAVGNIDEDESYDVWKITPNGDAEHVVDDVEQ